MPYPKPVPKGISSGLPYLLTVDSLVINRRLDLIEEFIGWRIPNAFTITDTNGKHMYYAMETSSCMRLFFCGGSRHVEINVYDNSHQEAIRFIRPLHWLNACCCPMVSIFLHCLKNTAKVLVCKESISKERQAFSCISG